ncbi:serine/threonine-protein kinase [Hyalangium versicolor]|uniref:serine/threonine-protein kinase n=1 Tax=Hyalangium versicolor TaxID=2861190 RepID=UPI001CCC10D8|nr:serine/threonine-protein kinase [Hyalangium versicolor]
MPPGGEESLYGEELAPGALVGGWVVEQLHYRGPVSMLYRARDARTGAPTALKVMRSQFTEAHTALRRFRREAETLQRLRHPHIVDVLGYGELADGRPFIAMEWLEGRDLAAELASRGPLSASEALEVLEQVGAALRAAHEAGVVHRDLKVQNVMRLQGGAEARVKLVDFGVAKGLTEGAPGASTLTQTGAVLGTPLSMAPEQIRGEIPDPRTDLYALGVLLFQLLTGQPPFQGSTSHEVEEQHLHTPPPRVSERAPVLAALDAVVIRCLQKRREDRYADVDEVLEDLRRAVRGEQGLARRARAVALYVEAHVEGEPDATALDQLDVVLERAGAVARVAGLEVKVDGAGCLLAAAPLPEGVTEAQASRARVLAAALDLLEYAGALSPSRRVRLSLTVHVDEAPPSRELAGTTPAEGSGLLWLPGWALHSGHGLAATGAALQGLESQFHFEPVPAGGTGLVQVTGRR